MFAARRVLNRYIEPIPDTVKRKFLYAAVLVILIVFHLIIMNRLEGVSTSGRKTDISTVLEAGSAISTYDQKLHPLYSEERNEWAEWISIRDGDNNREETVAVCRNEQIAEIIFRRYIQYGEYIKYPADGRYYTGFSGVESLLAKEHLRPYEKAVERYTEEGNVYRLEEDSVSHLKDIAVMKDKCKVILTIGSREFTDEVIRFHLNSE